MHNKRILVKLFRNYHGFLQGLRDLEFVNNWSMEINRTRIIVVFLVIIVI